MAKQSLAPPSAVRDGRPLAEAQLASKRAGWNTARALPIVRLPWHEAT